jgi:hypothetical protein
MTIVNTATSNHHHEGEHVMRSFYRFCAVAVVVVLLWGCAGVRNPPPPPPPPPRPRAVSIDILRTAMPGYVRTYGSNGHLYSYKFSGGNDRHGNASIKYGEGPNIPIQLDLANTSGFMIGDVEFTDDPDGQLSRNIIAGGLKATIVDKNKDGVALDAYYSVKVIDNSASPPAEVYCDPRIVNN